MLNQLEQAWRVKEPIAMEIVLAITQPYGQQGFS